MRPNKSGVRGLFKEVKRYRIDLRHAGGRYREILPLGATPTHARERAQQVLLLAQQGRLGTNEGKEDAPKKLKAAFTFYLDWIKGELGERAHKDRKLHADAWVATVGDLPLQSVGPLTFDKFKTERKKAGAANGTINRALTTAKHMIAQAARWGWLSKETAADLRTVKLLKEPPGRVRYLTQEERAKLDAALGANPRRVRFRRVVVATLYSGLRLSNVVGLRKDAVDIEAGRITLVKTKGNKVLRIPINETLRAILEEAMADSQGTHVFESSRGAPFSMSGGSSFFRKIVAGAGIEDFSFHDMRHDFATRLRRNQVGLDAISKLLGHSTLQMTARYAHLDDPTLNAAVAGLDEFPSATPPASSPPGPKRSKKA